MALVPLSLLFEILLPVIAFLLMEKGEFGRFIAVCIWPIEIALLVLPLAFFSDASGTLALVTITFPSNILGLVVLSTFLFWFYSLVDFWYFRQGIKMENAQI